MVNNLGVVKCVKQNRKGCSTSVPQSRGIPDVGRAATHGPMIAPHASGHNGASGQGLSTITSSLEPGHYVVDVCLDHLLYHIYIVALVDIPPSLKTFLFSPSIVS